MADYTSTRTSFRGLILPWRDLVYDADQSTITQAGPLPGSVEPTQDTDLGLVASGSMLATATYELRVQRPGFPTGDDDGLGLLWRHDDTEEWRGHDLPGTITGWECIDSIAAGAVIQPDFPASLALSDGTLLTFTGAENTGTSKEQVQVRRRSAGSTTWSAAITVYTAATTYPANVNAYPAPVLLPSGRILVFYYVYDEQTAFGAPADRLYIYMSYSDDDGVTWTLGSRTCAPISMAYATAADGASGYDATRGLVACYHEGSIGLWACVRRADTNLGLEYPREVISQGASNTLGAQFVEVCTSDYTNGDHADYLGCAPAVTVAQGRVVFAWAQYSLSVGSLPKKCEAKAVSLGSVWHPYIGAGSVGMFDVSGPAWYVASATSGGEALAWDLALCADDTGTAYAVERNYDSNSKLQVARSTDGGESWSGFVGRGYSDAGRVDSAANCYPWRLSAVWHDGRMLVSHQSNAVVATVGLSLGMMHFGGWTTVVRPLVADFIAYSSLYHINLSQLWIPIELPNNIAGVTAAGAGTGTLTGAELNISTAATARTYSWAVAGSVAEGVIAEVEVQPVTSSVVADAVVLTAIIADGVEEYRVTARIGTGAVVFRDDHATGGVGATIGTITLDATDGCVILLDVSGGRMIAYARKRTQGPDREWLGSVASDALTDAATYTAAAASSSVTIGHRSGIAESNWYRLSWDREEYLGQHLLDQQYPLDLQARHCRDLPVFIDGGLYIQAVDGPGYLGDEFDLAPRYEFGRERFDPLLYPSPRHTWRTTGTDPGTQVSQQTITWRVDDTITTASRPPGSTIALSVHRANWRTGSIRRRATGGAYTTVATIDAAAGMTALGFLRAGVAVYGDPGNTDPIYLHHGECRGWYIDLGSNFVRRIRDNTAGYFGGAAGKRATLYLEDVSDTEPTSGNAAIWPDQFAVVVEVDTTAYRAVQLIIDAQYTADGYIEAGTLLPGYFAPFAREQSWGRVVETRAGIERTEFRDRTDRVRKAAPVRRTVEVAWVDGVDLSGVSGTAHYAHTIDTSDTVTALPAGIIPETPIMLEALVDELDGGRVPCAYIAHLPKGDTGADTRIINRRERGPILVRYADSVRREVIQGTADHSTDGEVVRVATIALEEIP